MDEEGQVVQGAVQQSGEKPRLRVLGAKIHVLQHADVLVPFRIAAAKNLQLLEPIPKGPSSTEEDASQTGPG